jgi:DNA-binding MarR family transcriptional regulator
MSTGPQKGAQKAEQDRPALMAALNHAMRNASGQGVIYSQMVAERLGVSSSDLECLDFIVMRGPLTAGELAEATGLTTGAITGVIDRLEQAGFARRERDAHDRRKVLVRFQPGAERRLMPLFKPMERASMAALERYSDKELAFLLEFLTRLSEAAGAAMTELREQPKSPAKPGKTQRR